MFKEGPRYKDIPAKAGGEGWLVNDQQQKVCLLYTSDAADE